MTTEAAKPNIQERKRSLYFNLERLEDFDEIAGETILVEKLDAKGNPYQETLTVPTDLSSAIYVAFDYFVEFIRDRLPEDEE